MTDDIKLPELPEIRLPISKDDWYSHIEMLMHDYAREAVRMNAQVQRSDGPVIDYGTIVSDEFIQCFDSAFSFLANGHSIGQCFDMMKFAKAELIKSKKNKPAPRPVPTSERLPTAADADVTESVWLFNKMVSKWYLYHWRDVETAYISHWQPTGLVRPAEVKP